MDKGHPTSEHVNTGSWHTVWSLDFRPSIHQTLVRRFPACQLMAPFEVSGWSVPSALVQEQSKLSRKRKRSGIPNVEKCPEKQDLTAPPHRRRKKQTGNQESSKSAAFPASLTILQGKMKESLGGARFRFVNRGFVCSCS